MANMEYHYDSETSADDLDSHSEHDSDDYMTDSDVYDDDLDIEPVASSWAHVYPPEGIDCGSDLVFTQRNVGPLGIPNRNSQPIEYFSLFITDDIIDILVRETNIYANRFLASKEEWIREHPRSKYRIWKPVTHERMKKFLALSLLMGLIKVQDIKDFWSTFRSTRIPFYGETMPRDEYLLISRFLHLNDNTLNKPRGDPQYDPWFRVRPLLDSSNKLFKDHYNLQQTISLDESMIGMRNRCAFIQYMPNKRHCRYGIKKFELCEASTGYVYHIDVYSGRDFYATGSQQGFTHTVVMNIMEKSKVLNKGYHLITDNFYTKIPLAVWSSRSSAQTRHGEKIKPKVINDYNVGMGGVDLSDKKLYHYAAQRSTRRYWKKIYSNLIDVSVLNAYIIYQQNTDRPFKRDDFLRDIIECLSIPDAASYPLIPQSPGSRLSNSPGRNPIPVSSPGSSHVYARLDGCKQRLCAVCPKRSKHWCPG
ncbi:piggyBac transposable element-derived protein 4-like [Palaemon carinicauda]|uniref:piggyBac transposable element-derived protein 4-like n=1 Tax=Palaemon carinicauda TaxID=392227 RepID=UPI0035B66F98